MVRSTSCRCLRRSACQCPPLGVRTCPHTIGSVGRSPRGAPPYLGTCRSGRGHPPAPLQPLSPLLLADRAWGASARPKHPTSHAFPAEPLGHCVVQLTSRVDAPLAQLGNPCSPLGQRTEIVHQPYHAKLAFAVHSMSSGATQSAQKYLWKGVLRTFARRSGLPSCPPAGLCLAFTPSTRGNHLLLKTA